MPVVMAHNGLAVAGDVERRASLPSGIENLRHTSASWPKMGGKLLLCLVIPRRPLRRAPWVTRAFEPDADSVPIAVKDLDKCMGPIERDEPPTAACSTCLESARGEV
nr:hypothetical protein [Noviherbaspirillum sp. Root189]